VTVSIVIPVLDRLEFTRQCLDRIWRNTGDDVAYDVVIVDNGSSDGTREWFSSAASFPRPLHYRRSETNLGFARANNLGATLGKGSQLLFLNNDTLVQRRWLRDMTAARAADAAVGIVGIKQLFPYTNTVYHTGIVFSPEGKPEHLYPHLDASLPQVNRQRQYQAVTGSCLLIDRSLFEECGGFDEAYLNGYEDIDLCLKVRERGRKVVCCTSAFIYHYGQISEGRGVADDRNAALFAERWSGRIKPDRDEFLIRDAAGSERIAPPVRPAARTLAEDCIYFADDLDDGSALTWASAELALALNRMGVSVFVNGARPFSPTLPAEARQGLRAVAIDSRPSGGVQVKWSHYRPHHLGLELAGDVNLELFVINYAFGAANEEPWDYWIQCLRQNQHAKAALSEFCRSVLLFTGVPAEQCHVWHPGYSREIAQVDPPAAPNGRFRFLTVTNSHDIERYNTSAIVDAFTRVFGPHDDVSLVIKDYGASSGDESLARMVAAREGPPIELITEFTDKRELIRLYRSCDALVSAHRGEGFGMKILDGMACGLPVITPLFGGPTAYCRSDNCFPVAHSLVPMGDCLDARSLHITNVPLWAQIHEEDLGKQLRRVYDDRAAAAEIGSRAGRDVRQRFSWENSAAAFATLAAALRPGVRGVRPGSDPGVRGVRPWSDPYSAASPYWLGLRVSVVIPTRNRKEKLLSCLEALSRQSVLYVEFEAIVVDDGSTDGTREALEERSFPFALRYFRQDSAGPAAARNMGVDEAAGELVLFIGDDIIADERLLEAHLLAHAVHPDRESAVLGHIDWPASTTPNAVMECVAGDAKLQFVYGDIPKLPALDHRFFYTSNISLKRQFLVDAANAGIRFDPSFRRAAFEDSEFAFRLMPRGLRIHYAADARAVHDHWMNLDTFSSREFGAGEMAVVFYRKHPGLDDHLQVQWIADLVGPAAALLERPDLLQHLEAFDMQTDTLLRALAGSLEELIALERAPGRPATVDLSADRLRQASSNVLRVIFDVERTRGKVQEWYSGAAYTRKVSAAKTLATVLRKIAFLEGEHPMSVHGVGASIDRRVVAGLAGRLAEIPGLPESPRGQRSVPRRMRQNVRRLIAKPAVMSRLVSADRYIEATLQSASRPSWVATYRRVRSRIRRTFF
jgi:GT2 family glycosyltransferase/glycosyltransferase involved in cell wall biosynthesis